MGDVFSHFFDLNGRLVGMSVETLIKVPYSIGVVGGKLKAEAILGALRSKHVNILITDNTAAERVLKLDNKKA